MARRQSSTPSIDFNVTPAERAALERAASAAQTNVTAFVRIAALRAATRQDAIVRGHVQRMLGRDALIVRLLTDCGLVMRSAIDYATYQNDNPELKDAATRLTERIVASIKAIGQQS